MQHASKVIPSFAFLLTVLLANPLWATTYAYIPSYDNDKVVRVATGTTDFTSATISNDNSCGPYGVAVAPNGRTVLVSCAKSGELVALYNSDFTEESDLVPTEQILSNEAVNILRGVAFDPQGQYVFLVNDQGDSTNGSVIQAASTDPTNADDMVEKEVGRGPKGIAVIRINGDDADTLKAYVANYIDGSVTVIRDDGTEIITATISDVGNNPVGVAASPDGRWVYVANYNAGSTGSVAIINTSTDTVVNTITVGNGAWGVAMGSFGNLLFVTNNAGNSVSVINTVNQTLYSTEPVGTQPAGIAAPKNGDFAYAYNLSGSVPISLIDVSTATVLVDDIAQNSDHQILAPYALGVGIGGIPPSAPTSLAGTSVSYDSIDLTWVDNSSDELGFKIERREQGDTDYVEIARVDADTESYTDESGLVSNTTYEYRIRSYNEAADSGYASMSEDEGITTEEGGFSWCFIGSLF